MGALRSLKAHHACRQVRENLNNLAPSAAPNQTRSAGC
jgi:hypothetical protein